MKIKAYSEFGFILWYYLPKAYSFYLKGELEKTESKIGTSSLFYFSPNHEEKKLHELPFKNFLECYKFVRPSFTKNNWVPPPLNEHFKNEQFLFEKPILTIHNKNLKEWGNSGIFNYFNQDILYKLFKEFNEKFQIVYIRPDSKSFKFQKDNNQEEIEINDIEVLNDFDDVIYINDLFEKFPTLSYNEIQFKILANSNHHIAPAGDAVIPSYFGGDLIIFNCKECMSRHRKVWNTNSWLSFLSGSNIYGYKDYDSVLNKAKELWK